METPDIREYCLGNIPGLTGEGADRFRRYYELLMEWNGRVNLTAITDPAEAARKHFGDSVLPMGLIPRGAKVIDVGSGAGFPGVPIALMRPDISLTLLDSLNKRVAFLRALCRELGVAAECVHARAEDGGRDPALRGKFDAALSRAVAPAPALAEYTVPFLKVGGRSLMYKGPKAGEELALSRNALDTLFCRGEIREYRAPWGVRNIIIVTKLRPTPRAYPRRAGTASKNPL